MRPTTANNQIGIDHGYRRFHRRTSVHNPPHMPYSPAAFATASRVAINAPTFAAAS